MNDIGDRQSSGRVYRVDRFVVPGAARDEFLARVRATHALLKRQAGFLQDFLLEEPRGPDASQIVTIVEWESPGAIPPARAAVQSMHRQTSFDPQEMIARLGIDADLGTYREIRGEAPAG